MQKMSEKEAIKNMTTYVYMECENIPQQVIKALNVAREALEEIQQYRAIGTVEELQKSVKEEDILKFYYIESEDKYVVGKRIDNFYYAEVGKTGLSFYMSRYLPWGEHVVSPRTLWKEYTYPSEPKEIPFFEWLQGFIKKECGGTVEECREAVERMKPRKPYYVQYDGKPNIGNPHCSNCCGIISNGGTAKGTHCKWCGQHLDWSE